jgi:hypothetical protein
MTDKNAILACIIKMIKGKNSIFNLTEDISNFILNASLTDIKDTFDSLSKFDKMTFRNRVYMSILHDKCEKVMYKIKDGDKTIKVQKPMFTEKQNEIVNYINEFSGIVDPKIAFDDELVYAAENQALIALITTGQA